MKGSLSEGPRGGEGTSFNASREEVAVGDDCFGRARGRELARHGARALEAANETRGHL